MQRLEAAVVAVAAASLSLLGACGDDSNEMGPNGGAGGSQGGSAGNGGAAAGAAGSGGSAGMAGTAGMAGSAGAGGTSAARLQAAVSGDVLTLTPLDPVWFMRCSNAIQSVQRVNRSWTPLRDDRPEAFGGHYGAHYLDGTLHSARYLSWVVTSAPALR